VLFLRSSLLLDDVSDLLLSPSASASSGFSGSSVLRDRSRVPQLTSNSRLKNGLLRWSVLPASETAGAAVAAREAFVVGAREAFVEEAERWKNLRLNDEVLDGFIVLSLS